MPNTTTDKTTTKTTDSGEKEVQATVDAAEDKGYFGDKVDDRPNEDYTLAGVTKNRK